MAILVDYGYFYFGPLLAYSASNSEQIQKFGALIDLNNLVYKYRYQQYIICENTIFCKVKKKTENINTYNTDTFTYIFFC